MNVYLAGGLHSDWRTFVKDAVPTVKFFDPTGQGSDESIYTLVEIGAMQTSDLIFAYMDEANFSGYGTSFECGYAIGARIPLWFVDETTTRSARFGMHRASASRVFTSLADAVFALGEKACHDT